jgi:hypothetical protein
MAAIEALPYAVALGYAEALEVLKLAPWSGNPLREDNPDGNIRTLAFGPGGLATYLILEDQRRVDVLQVHWAGEQTRVPVGAESATHKW